VDAKWYVEQRCLQYMDPDELDIEGGVDMKFELVLDISLNIWHKQRSLLSSVSIIL
jgi:hypothetical protein